MKTVKLHEAELHLAELVEAVTQGEEIIISRHGKPVAKLTGLAATEQRELGFYPIEFESNLLEPTDRKVVTTFYRYDESRHKVATSTV